MKLSARPLIDVSSVNDYGTSEQLEMTAGDSPTLYLQLIDLEKNLAKYGYEPAGLRYMPLATTTPTLAVTFTHIDDAKQFTRFATQPFTQDPSIWACPILASDPIAGTVTIKCVLTENKGTSLAPIPVQKTFTMHAAVLVGV